MRPSRILAWVLALLVAAPAAAQADEGGKCTFAYEHGQQLRIAKHLTEAAAEFATCVIECPAVLAKDCRTWQDEIAREMPKVTFRALGSDGCEAKTVRLRLDDAKETFAPGGKIEVDPGRHKVTALGGGTDGHEEIFDAEGGEPRVVDVVLPAKACTQVVSPAPRPEETTMSRPVPTLVYVLGGIGIAGAGSFLGFGISGLSQRGDLDDRCKPSCPEADVDAMRRTYLVADISLGVSIVALSAALYLYLARPQVTTGSAHASR